MNARILDQNGLLLKLVLVSSISTAIALTLGIILAKSTFTILTIILLSSNSIVFYLAQKKKFTPGIHLILISHILIFLTGALSGIHGYSLLLIYPAALYMSILFLHDERQQQFYVVISILASIISIYMMLQPGNGGVEIIKFIVETIIVIGILLGVYMIGQSHLSRLNDYQEELEHNESIIMEKNQELTRYIENNLQLESFAHLASHELKTPVRNISNFTGLLKRKVDHKLEEEEKEILGFITDQTQYIYGLITDLLNLSSISSEKAELSQIILKSMIDEVVDKNFMDKKNNIHVSHLPDKIYGNLPQLSLVIKNIIENGLKYVAKGVEPNILIDGEECPKYTIIRIADNGIGIGENYKDKIFLIFKRLHIQSEYEGNGFGLAYCKKIIENHKGRIKVTDNPTGGTIFSLILPNHID